MKDTDATLIDRLGGTKAVAEALKRKAEAVKKWRQNGIPWNRRREVLKLAREMGKRLPADFLVERRPAEKRAA